MSTINVYTGPMKSGKTKLLIEKYLELKKQGKRCVMIKPDIDKRFSEKEVVDRDGNKIPCYNIHKLYELDRLMYLNDYIFIDEFQFLSGDIKIITDAADYRHKEFYISGLNLTTDKNTFGLMGNLLCIADNIVILKGKCDLCGKPSKYSFCTVEKKNTILIGDDVYKSVCEKCYNKLMENKSV